MENFKNEQKRRSSLRNGNESPIPIPKLGAREGVPFLLCRSAELFRSSSLITAGQPSRPHTTALCELELTTPTPPTLIFGGVLEEGAFPWPDASSEAG